MKTTAAVSIGIFPELFLLKTFESSKSSGLLLDGLLDFITQFS